MSKYYEINAQGKFRIPKISDKDTYTHNGEIDISRLIYSEADERLCIGTLTNWMPVSTPYDIFDQNTKVLIGSYPLPTGWNLNTIHNDKVVLITDDITEVEDTGGSWVFSGMAINGSHTHSMGNPSTIAQVDSSSEHHQFPNLYHIHSVSSDSGHVHIMDGTWRPYNIKYCIAEYQ